ncbi:Sterol 3-beta-glucosyltransferase UGT80B1 [Striga hermonthica]|uniref:Sterol 3-beta-glucosyltransferase UGT80B1 n=1 Tax=Striga hermonthica TaxID=68872 RepID=A0A9N7RJ56_STRHE|nr:Sterol 3-beta-glucosyltransferase UGT80B1 [Striga hermonthica]
MDSSVSDKMPRSLEFDVCRAVSTNSDQIHEVTKINLDQLSNLERDDLEDQCKSTSSELDEQSYSYSTPPRNHLRTSLLHSTSFVEVSRSNFSPSPQVQKVLDHCFTAPVHRKLFLEGQDVSPMRPLTERRGSPMPSRKLDRLSESEKKNLIVNLVKIQKDGTVEVDLTQDSPVASELLEFHPVDEFFSSVDYITTDHNKSIPKLKIAMLVVGTRGDVQPFLAVARRLQEYGHHVRLATHSNFRGFVKAAGVDFYPLGGDPRVLAGYMARNKGLIPSAPGEISVQRKQIKAIIESLLPACTEPDPITGELFRAQAIIANPPAYGHAHIAEALGVPLHIFFTMPWTPTYDFPHPLARVPQSAGNWLSYILVDLLIWWGIRGHINNFRKNKLKLSPIAYFSTYHGSISHLPTGYMWSPHVVPKPKDWGPLVDVVGYCFLNLGSRYQPPDEFVQWIENGTQPIYIGFGSMPLEDSNKTTNIILEALKNTGQRGIIDRGWGELGTPTGLKAGCPTTIVPFFGDQFFWGERIHQKGLGPAPIPISQLSVDSLSEAITFMLQPEVKSRAMEIATCIQKEDGVGAAVDAFHCHLPPEVPLTTTPPSEKYDSPNPLQWIFLQIGRVCSLACGS